MAESAVYLFALGAAVLFSAYGLLARVLSVKSDNPIAFASVYGFSAALASLIAILAEPLEFRDITGTVIIATFIATVFYGIYEATQFFMRKHMEASRSTLFYQLTPVITFVASFFILNETASPYKIAGILLIVAGNMIAVYEHGGNVTKKGLGLAFAAVASLGFAYVADKIAVPHYPIGFYMFISYLFPALYMIPLIRGGKLESLRGEWRLAGWKIPALGAISALGYYCILKTFTFAEVSLAVPIAFTGTLLTVLGGIVILGERSNVPQKIAAAVLVFVGVLLLR